MIEVVSFRTRARPMPVPMLDGKGWYRLATSAVRNFEESTQTHRSYIDMVGEDGPIRILVPVGVEWLDQQFAEATFCPVLFRNTDDETLLVG